MNGKIIREKGKVLGIIINFDSREVEYIVPEDGRILGEDLFTFILGVKEFLDAFEKEGEDNNETGNNYSPREYN
jgi:hypothetical protein